MKLENIKLSKLKPYENNPRNNENAVDVVKESIKQCGYIAPIIVDENMVILAGHTRYKALTEMNVESCDVIVKEGLSEEQKKKYRILDNKTNEFADWDFEKLEEELDGLDFEDFDFGLENINKSYIDDLMTERFAEHKTEPDEFQVTFTFPIDLKEQFDEYMKTNKQFVSEEIIRMVTK